nr:helix-turn-helix domain-containing protein [Salinicoccus roseus]
MTGRNFSPEEKLEIIQEWIQGVSPSHLAVKHRLPDKTLREWRRKYETYGTEGLKRRQAQGIAIAKSKGVYKGRPILYAPNARDPQKRLVYHRVVAMLNDGMAISKIAKEVGITRQTVYRIKNELQ